jgi:adenosine deaminase
VSNLKLDVVETLSWHPVPIMLSAGLLVTINSDDPAYFGGYVNDNFLHCHRDMGLSKDDLIVLARNGFLGSFLPADEARRWAAAVDDGAASS